MIVHQVHILIYMIISRLQFLDNSLNNVARLLAISAYEDAAAASFFAWNSANLASSSGLKCQISPCTGHAAPSAKAHIVCPSICFVNSQSRSISSGLALPSTEKENLM